MWLKAVMEASVVCFQKSCSRIWKGRSLICCVCHVLILCCNILSCGTRVTLKDTQFAVYSLGYNVCVKLLFDSGSLYMEEEQNQLGGSSLHMNPCKIRPESANTQTSWILYLNVIPSQETRSHNCLSAPSASGERQKTQELEHKPINPNLWGVHSQHKPETQAIHMRSVWLE